MNSREQRIYRLELSLIKRYFRGLRPRPVQLAKQLELGADGEAGEPNLVIKDRRRSRQKLVALLKHELIHYQLKDQGEFFHGHGRAFLKRAQALGIVNSYVLERCFSSEEFDHTPTVRTTKKVPLAKFTRQIDRWFSQLISEAVKLPEPHGTKLYPHVQNAYVGWLTYSAAVKAKSDHVIQEIWRIKPGPRAKGLHELQKEYGSLKSQQESLTKQVRTKAKARDGARLKPQLRAIDAQLARIRERVKKDYGILLR